MRTHGHASRQLISRRQMLQSGALLTLAACGRGAAPIDTTADRPNFIVILADAMRADRAGCYGFPRPTTPAIDDWSRGAMRYGQCIAQASWTKPSIGSLWTGVPAEVHRGIVSSAAVPTETRAPDVHVLRSSFPTLAERLAAAGYHTALYLSNPQVQDTYGFARGFEQYRYVRVHEPEEQMTEALAWLQHEAVEPFFLFVHVIDPHAPYLPDAPDFEHLFGHGIAEARADLDPQDLAILDSYDHWYEEFTRDPDLQRPNLHALSPAGIKHLEQLYLAEFPRVDRQMERMLAYLDETGLSTRTVTAFTSDHGEAFNEHDTLQHGMSLYHEELHVPLIVGGAGIGSGVVDEPVALSDLCPTLLRMAGAAGADETRWHMPLPGAGGGRRSARRAIHAMTNRFQPEESEWQYGMYYDQVKIIASKDGLQVFDLRVDPGELDDLMDTPRALTTRIQRALRRFEADRAEMAAEARAHGPDEWTTMPDEDREALEGIGYV